MKENGCSVFVLTIYIVRPYTRSWTEKVVEEKEQSETDFFFAARVSRPLTFVQG